MKLISPNFNDGEFLKQEYSLSKEYGFGCAGKNIRPHLEWKGFSDQILEYAITIFDPDAPTGSGFWHWILVNINKNYRETDEDCISNSLQIQNDFGSYGYGGPCPPKGDQAHRYFFTIYGLKEKIEAHENTPAAQIGFQLHFKSLEKASLMALFKHH
jgi:hypothetical protein|tara:strand:+ start:134 stop:604 length:471 start_codon:yes stop_codon:yes gene_type:complete